MLRTQGRSTLSAGREGQEGAARGMTTRAGHPPPVAEAGFLGLQCRGLQEDFQGFREGTLFKQALALGTQEAVIPACDPAAPQLQGAPRGQEGREIRNRDTALQI